MPLYNSVKIYSIHQHPLSLLKSFGKNVDQMTEEEKGEACWTCNGNDLFQGGCKSGIEDYGLHPDIKVWRCEKSSMVNGEIEECDIDICEMCVRWTLHCERTGTDLGRLR